MRCSLRWPSIVFNLFPLCALLPLVRLHFCFAFGVFLRFLSKKKYIFFLHQFQFSSRYQKTIPKIPTIFKTERKNYNNNNNTICRTFLLIFSRIYYFFVCDLQSSCPIGFLIKNLSFFLFHI